jgi:hypothetical protein
MVPKKDGKTSSNRMSMESRAKSGALAGTKTCAAARNAIK